MRRDSTSLDNHYQHYVKRGKCPRCGKDNDARTVYCPPCHQYMLELNRIRAARLKAEGRCLRCKEPLEDGDGYFTCRECRLKAKIQTIKRSRAHE